MSYDRTAGSPSVTQSVVEAVAEADGVGPEELAPPLYEEIDPDALERIFATGPSTRRVVFTYNGYEVTVRGDGSVSIHADGDRPR